MAVPLPCADGANEAKGEEGRARAPGEAHRRGAATPRGRAAPYAASIDQARTARMRSTASSGVASVMRPGMLPPTARLKIG